MTGTRSQRCRFPSPHQLQHRASNLPCPTPGTSWAPAPAGTQGTRGLAHDSGHLAKQVSSPATRGGSRAHHCPAGLGKQAEPHQALPVFHELQPSWWPAGHLQGSRDPDWAFSLPCGAPSFTFCCASSKNIEVMLMYFKDHEITQKPGVQLRGCGGSCFPASLPAGPFYGNTAISTTYSVLAVNPQHQLSPHKTFGSLLPPQWNPQPHTHQLGSMLPVVTNVTPHKMASGH